MISRRRLSNRRASETFEREVQGLKFTATVSRFADGHPAEIFLQNHKAGSAAGILASEAAISASLALQYGCPVDVLRRALCRDSQGRASGPLGATLDKLAERQ
jgi:ribonucleoside-diphosphate reductase alpha chain